MSSVQITSALVSVYHKENLEPLIRELHFLDVQLYSTGGTQTFIEELGIPVTAVEDVTEYPSIFGGRVKTLHPKIFGGILHRRDNERDEIEKRDFNIPSIDLVIVDLYPFEETVASGAGEEDIIEKIDIGGISLIRAAAKNYKDVLIVSSREQYDALLKLLKTRNGNTTLDDRRRFALEAFETSSHYDTAIYEYFAEGEHGVFKQSVRKKTPLRYGENPHQQAAFFGDLETMFDKLNGKELSYNNLVDVDAAVNLMAEFTGQTAFAILKHTNACGAATGNSVKEAYEKALAADPVSAFGGVLITNHQVDLAAAEELNKLFFEVLIAPSFADDALELLRSKKNRILLLQKPVKLPRRQFKTLLNGVIVQDADTTTETAANFTPVTERQPTAEEMKALEFGLKLAKHTKSNTIVLATADRLLSSGVGQTSRVDALKQAIEKARNFGFSLEGAAMASDAFFPFPDCVAIAHEAGITAVVQPGGSIKDQESIDACNQRNMAMVTTGVRHFKH